MLISIILNKRFFSSSMIQNTKLALLREQLKTHDLAAYLVPHNDAHDSEYIAEEDERLAYISGFTGSAGTALISNEKAYLWTDSRYWLQAEKELLPGWELKKQQKGVPTWFEESGTLFQGSSVGFDPALISASIFINRQLKLKESNVEFKSLDTNLIDAVWEGKIEASKNQIFIHESEFVGKSVQQKLYDTFVQIKAKNSNSTLLANLAQIAWLLNLRGSDIMYNPVFKSYLYIKEENGKISGILYVDPEKVQESVKAYLLQNSIEVKPYNQVVCDAQEFDATILINTAEINTLLFQQLKGHKKIEIHPIESQKAVKDEREVRGFRESHIRDGAALCRYLAWLENALTVEQRTDLNEYSAALVLENFRKQAKYNMGLSFATISSSGPNAAIVHYHPKQDANSKIVRDQIYLLDSGGQYLDGTTDVTKTIHFGTPTQEEKNAYTRVLLGNLDIERLQYPANANIHGGDIDVLARRWLWADQLDYGHGTGHGVGYFLNVHEGPNGISKYRSEPLVPGMIVSNEPGYYKDGSFGIRIENLLVVVPKKAGFWGFENLTICPYDRNLIDLSLLSQEYVQHINAYNQRVRELLFPQIQAFNDEIALRWIEERTKPL